MNAVRGLVNLLNNQLVHVYKILGDKQLRPSTSSLGGPSPPVPQGPNSLTVRVSLDQRSCATLSRLV